ncbi:CBN-ELO-4 protein [Caenorhabditis brenneri]|uniref:CBN-ELO-4 protein n=1 Tax=Caenorhabditis brenneri TaxID=135651 RepID=G0MJZ9_CAEBE|nr:CBN-ELO-4 protein [Caenorhabditis brenneri]
MELAEFWNELNTFTIYGPNHTDMTTKYKYPYHFPGEQVEDPQYWTILFQKYWYHSITISVLYFALIKVIQKFMENRKPFTLRYPLILWNGALAAFSIIATLRFSIDPLRSLYAEGFYKTLCYSCNPTDVAAFWSFAFALSKIVELGDTMFIILRKKPLIFLHYYHHAAVLIYTVHSGAEHTAAGRFYILMNYFAHSLMYTYYTVSAIGYRMPKWVSMTVTTVQTVQMLAGVGITWMVYKVKADYKLPCQQSMANLYLAFVIYVTFAILFIQFFVKAYIVKSAKKSKSVKNE